MKGSKNRVYVLSGGHEKRIPYIFKNNEGSPYGALMRFRELSNEVNFSTGKNYLYTYPKRSWKDVVAAIHIMGEGFAAGYGKGYYYKRSPGLSYHFSQQAGARSYWLDYYSVKSFKSWW